MAKSKFSRHGTGPPTEKVWASKPHPDVTDRETMLQWYLLQSCLIYELVHLRLTHLSAEWSENQWYTPSDVNWQARQQNVIQDDTRQVDQRSETFWQSAFIHSKHTHTCTVKTNEWMNEWMNERNNQSINQSTNPKHTHYAIKIISRYTGLGTQNFYFQDRKNLKFQDIFQDIRVTKNAFLSFRAHITSERLELRLK